jgi:hypothetical protein
MRNAGKKVRGREKGETYDDDWQIVSLCSISGSPYAMTHGGT